MNFDPYALAGQEHVFVDGVIIRILQVKQRDQGLWVTYESIHKKSLPQRFMLKIDEFVHHFGHLFKISE